MCGIFGGFDRTGAPFGNTLAEVACHRMRHRGPDDQGYWECDGMLVCNRRLSILDLSSGRQPMLSDDGQVAVVQNGEIYNYLELSPGLGCRTRCDTEVILRLYERDGEDFVSRLNGMFAIAILDRRRQRLLLYRDRTGKKPLYLYDDGRRLLFASEIKSLLAAGVPARMDETALDAFLTYNFVPPPSTLFRGVRHLMPGHRLIIDRQSVREEAWWSLADVATEEKAESEWTDEIVETLRQSVRIRLRADVPLGAFLSGGIDSSAVVRLMSDELPRPVRTFCIGFEDPRFDESRHAQVVASACRTRHVCRTLQVGTAFRCAASLRGGRMVRSAHHHLSSLCHGQVGLRPEWVTHRGSSTTLGA
jgi:asparagine synthase (glutamine-hydrolysing)